MYLKHLHLSIVTGLILMTSWTGSAQSTHPKDAAIKKVLQTYFDAMSDRDTDVLPSTVSERFLAMDVITLAGNKEARIQLLDTKQLEKMLPPEGNDDMQGMQVTSLKVLYSNSNPTAAVASFLAERPLSETHLERFKQALSRFEPNEANQAVRDQLQKMITDGKIHLSMLAMLGKQNGQWKIVAMSFPE